MLSLLSCGFTAFAAVLGPAGSPGMIVAVPTSWVSPILTSLTLPSSGKVVGAPSNVLGNAEYSIGTGTSPIACPFPSGRDVGCSGKESGWIGASGVMPRILPQIKIKVKDNLQGC